MQLSKLESEAYENLRRNGVLIFRIKDICLLLKINKIKAYNIVKALKIKGVLKKIGKGFFFHFFLAVLPCLLILSYHLLI